MKSWPPERLRNGNELPKPEKSNTRNGDPNRDTRTPDTHPPPNKSVGREPFSEIHPRDLLLSLHLNLHLHLHLTTTTNATDGRTMCTLTEAFLGKTLSQKHSTPLSQKQSLADVDADEPDRRLSSTYSA